MVVSSLLPRRLYVCALAVAAVGVVTLHAQVGSFQPSLEGEIWQQLAPFGSPVDPSCIVLDDGVNGQGASCPPSGGPPPAGQLAFPIGIAIDGPYVFVSDNWNHRVQRFYLDGTPAPLPFPIGTGTAGSSTENQLNYPEQLAVDAAHKILVADHRGDRIAVFNPDGSPAFDVGMLRPTGVAVKAGVTVGAPGSNCSTPGPPAVAVVNTGTEHISTDGVRIYDANLCPLEELIGAGVGPGEFLNPTSVRFDNAGHVLVADFDNNRIQILDESLNYLFSFGEPADFDNLQPFDLQSPWSVIVDHRGRAIVSDTENQRLAVYSLDFDAKSATFLYDLDAHGDLDGYPRGLAEDTTIDPAGRLHVVDTTNHRVQRFQVPELAVAGISVSPAGSVQVGDTITLTMSVVVPVGKPAVANVTPTVGVIGPAQLVSNGPNPSPQPPESLIGPGQIQTYTFTYRATVPNGQGGDVTFTVGANGTPVDGMSPTFAPERAVTARVACVGCETIPPSSSHIVTDPLVAPANNWYGSRVTFQITASDTSGVAWINYEFEGPEHGVQNDGRICPDGSLLTDPGGACSAPPSATVMGSITLTAETPTGSTLRYWAEDIFGNVESPVHEVLLHIDMSEPIVNFMPPPVNGSHNWYREGVTLPLVVPFEYSDDLSGAVLISPPGPTVFVERGTGNISFAGEGAGQFQQVHARDGAGNDAVVRSDDPFRGGRPINIDITPPTISFGTANPGPNSNGWFKADVSMPFTATDNLSGFDELGTRTLTSTAAISGEGVGLTANASATDYAGNSSNAVTPGVNIDRTPPAIVLASLPPPVHNGWYHGDVAVPFTATDTLSGFAGGATSIAGTVTITGEGAGLSATASATDRAGNTRSEPTPAVKIDRAGPVLTAIVSPAPIGGWNNARPVTVTFIATEPPSGSGVATVTPPVVVDTETSGQIVTGTATDHAGHTTTLNVAVRINTLLPPHAFNVFDPVTKDVKVYGVNAVTGAAFGPITPTSVVPTTWGHDDEDACDDDEDDGDDDDVGGHAELRTFRIGEPGSDLVLVEKVKRAGKEIKVRLVSFQYSNGPLFTPKNATKKFEWSVEKDGTFKSLVQQTSAYNGSERISVHAKHHGGKTNKTEIHDRTQGVNVTPAGLALLRMRTTAEGGLVIEY